MLRNQKKSTKNPGNTFYYDERLALGIEYVEGDQLLEISIVIKVWEIDLILIQKIPIIHNILLKHLR